MRQVKVYLDDRRNGGRKIIEADILEERETTLKVRLPDGNIITRKKTRDLPRGEKDENSK